MTLEKPNRSYTLTVNGEETEVVMSFAMFQEIMKVIPSPENIAHLLIQDFYLREYVLRRLLTGPKKVRSDEDMIDLFEVDADPEALDDMLLWVADHILYFFMTTAGKSVTLGEKYKAKMEALTQSAPLQTGSPD